MHDEVCPTYQDMLLNLVRGFDFLWDEFKFRPRVALAIDKSGHSITHPRLLAESGIQSLYLLNVNPKEREQRKKKKELQFLWRPFYQHIGKRAEIFTHILYDYQLSPLSLHVSDDPTMPSASESG